MLNIYAASFMTATRLNAPKLRDAPKPNAPKRKRWLPAGHWWVSKSRELNPRNL